MLLEQLTVELLCSDCQGGGIVCLWKRVHISLFLFLCRWLLLAVLGAHALAVLHQGATALLEDIVLVSNPRVVIIVDLLFY